MNDDLRLERLFADGMHELAPRRAPDRLRTTIKAETAEVRSRARWLALVKEPPMRTNNHLAVGSPTARVAAILAATLLLAVALAAAGVAGQRLLASDGAIVVAQDGSGDYTTIAEAVAAAAEGDEILVRPGTYTEAVVIDKDVTLRGDGPVDEVVLGPVDGVLITLNDSAAEIADLTLRGDELTQGMLVNGGAPTIRGAVFDHTGLPFRGVGSGSGSSLEIVGGEATVIDNTFLGGGEISLEADANAVLEGNRLIDGPHIYLPDPGDAAVLRGNTISAPLVRAIGQYGPGSPLIEGNTITASVGNGIDVGGGSPRLLDNTITDSGYAGISVSGTREAVEVSGNTLRNNRMAIAWDLAPGVIASNIVEGGAAGIAISSGTPEVRDNVIEGATGRGFVLVGARNTPTLSGNRSCGNGENLFVDDKAQPVIDDTNEICADESAA